MAATPSTMMPIGTKAPGFNLTDTVSGRMVGLSDSKGEKATAVIFICNHCPYVLHIIEELVKVAKEYIPKGVSFIAISSNDVKNYPDDSPELMKKLAHEMNFPFPYLYDESQEVARAYNAACTPDFFVFDKDLKCAYRGQFDDSRPKNGIPPTGKDLRRALNEIISGKPVSGEQRPSMGCNIKWKS